jgi:hypothetical protein
MRNIFCTAIIALLTIHVLIALFIGVFIGVFIAVLIGVLFVVLIAVLIWVLIKALCFDHVSPDFKNSIAPLFSVRCFHRFRLGTVETYWRKKTFTRE